MRLTSEDKKTIKQIADKIREVREHKQWTQDDVSKRAKIDSNSYAKIERANNC